MTIRKLSELTGILPRGRPVLGLDLGAKTIGLALSDVTLLVASPLKTHRRAKFSADAASLLALVDEHRIAALVIGLPVLLAVVCIASEVWLSPRSPPSGRARWVQTAPPRPS